MIEVYKLGASFYKNNPDKNSGLYEYNLIKQKLSKITKKAVVIINGIRNKEDDEAVNSLLKKRVPKIFIASDICFKDNVDIINRCDYLLHQAGFNYVFRDYCNELGISNKVKLEYSWVPELFYKKPDKKPVDKMYSEVLFGGGHISEDVLNCYSKYYPVKQLTRVNLVDNRLPYDEYMELQKHYRMSLIISREEYWIFGWVTSRFIEAVSCNCIPLLDKDYDMCNHYRCEWLKMYSKLQYRAFCNEILKNNELVNLILTKLHLWCAHHANDFVKLVEKIAC